MSSTRGFSLCLLAVTAVVARAQIIGPSVNMVSGTEWPGGDPFLQRQNGPSFAVSTRNPLHLIAGDNDYRTVDLPGLPDGQLTGDAWLGVFQSADGGKTWTSTLLPGYPQDTSPIGQSSPAHQFLAGTDPVMRPGTNGMAYYAGLVFNRTPVPGGNFGASAIVVSRYLDDNFATGDPFQYLDTHLVAQGGAPQTFTDKPWIAVDIPRAGAQTCTVGGSGGVPMQSFAGGNIYVTYTLFAGDQLHGAITFQRSTDCGVTWGAPITLTDSSVTRQGTAIAIDPRNGWVYVSWRQFQGFNVGDALLVAKSTDGGQTFSAPQQVAAITPFDQGSTVYSIRTNSYPAMVVDGAGQVYIAWAQRGVGPGGDGRIVISTSSDGMTWSAPTPADNQPNRGHQFMPALTFAGGHLMLIYYDLRDDSTVGIFTPLGGGIYSEARQAVGDLANPPTIPTVFTFFLDDTPPRALRHTIDVRVAQGNPAAAPVFESARVSSYEFGSVPDSDTIQQLQIDPPNFPLFSGGTEAYVGDYLDIAALMFVHDANGNWTYNTAPASDTVFHAAWTDNRDVRPPADGDWTHYTPPPSASLGVLSLFDPSQPTAACVDGQEGMRNQNIYSANVTGGLVASAAESAKLLTSQLRAFTLTLENTTSSTQTFRLTVLNQPPGGRATFSQSTSLPTPLLRLDVSIPAYSTIARSLFVSSTNPAAQVRVLAQQITAPGGAVITGGLQSTIVLNADTSDPNLGLNSPNPNNEVYTPTIANPNIANPNIANPNIANPNIANPNIANPNIANPNIANPNIANPNIANPNIANPNIANPNIANPNIGAGDLTNGTVTDVTWAVTNTGNTAMAYTVKSLLNGQIPTGFITQLMIHQVYTTPVALNCVLGVDVHTKLLVNITNPVFEQASTNDAGNPAVNNSAANDPTVALGPGETANITLRFVNPDKTTNTTFDYANTVITTITSHAANTTDVQQGNLQPPVAASQLIVVTQALPNAAAGTPYSVQLLSSGGVGAVTWSTPNLPANGLTLNAATGVISGTPTGSASPLTINVTATDSSGKIATRSFSLTVVTPPPPTVATASLPVGYPGVPYNTTLLASNGSGSKTWSLTGGSLPSGWILDSSTGQITGSATAASSTSLTFTVTDGLGRTASRTLTLTIAPLTLAFTQQPVNVAPLAPQLISVSATSSGAGVAAVPISIAIVLSNGTTFNTVNVTTAPGGAASTNISLPSGVYHLVASAPGATGATSNTFAVGSPHLVITAQPVDTLAQPSTASVIILGNISVRVVDSTGAGISGANVTIAIGTNPSSGTLSGTTTVAADATGLAFFRWTINNAGVGYTLVASSPGVPSVTSDPFNVVFGYDATGSHAAGGASPSPQTPSPDLIRAIAYAFDGNLNLAVTFAPGTYLAPTTVTYIELDTDQNPGTGSPGVLVGSQIIDKGILGWDYLVTYTAGNATATIQSESDNSFFTVGTVPVNNLPANPGFFVTIPLSMLGNASGKLNFRVATGALSGGQFTLTDALPSVGLPPVVVNVPGTPALELTATNVQVASGTSLNAAVWLTQPAPAPGVTVNLSTTPSGVLTVPASVVVPTGAITAPFTASAVASGDTTITATAAGYDSAQTTIDVPLGSIIMPATISVAQGQSVTVPITLSQAAPAGGTTVFISNFIDMTVATVSPASVFVPAGQTVPTTSVQVTGVGTGTTTIFTGADLFFGGNTKVTVTPPSSLAFVTQPANALPGLAITPPVQVLILDGSGTPVPGVNVTIAIGINPSSGTLSGTTTETTDVTGTATFADLSINNLGTGYTLVASSSGVASVTSNAFDVTGGFFGSATDPARDALPSSVSPSPDLVSASATAVNGNLELSLRFAPGTFSQATTGIQIYLDTDQNPGTGGQLGSPSAPLDGGVLGWDYEVTISGGVNANVIQYLISGPVAVGASAPILYSANGIDVTVPLSLLGNASGKLNFKVTTSVGQPAFITDALPDIGLPPVVVNVPGTPAMTLSSDATQVPSGETINGTVNLTQPAPPGGLNVNLVSSAPGVASVSPSSISIAEGNSSGSFTITGASVGTTTISATASGYDSAITSIQVPIGQINLGFVPSFSVGQTVGFTVSLSQAAPATGTTIYLVADPPGIATVTSSVFIPAGQTTPVTLPQLTGVSVGSTNIVATADQFIANQTGVTVIP